jgi:four helix bundle protein
MQDVQKLAVYREARQLAVNVYRLTSSFPASERFGLTQQMRRAAVSVGSNIAEGCGRKGSRALLPFLYYAIGSSKELEFQLDLSEDLGHCGSDEADVARRQLLCTRRMLVKLSEAVRRRAECGVVQSPPTPHSPPVHPR